ncbi:SRPBCC family protein [Mucilaginibacter sp. UR6-1]|uniref:SRPBCC family protein n=1 Tax=Mucilaginibacter sp. UR6-1 TaxID=1435643 RepID=UPI001E5D2684|nr:SRPBCC family protein [Mucilaginibacter sp. UR6-1]MCC8410977.1 SRPBCC family protein [Mucilaginibacter sp. UR6-1]
MKILKVILFVVVAIIALALITALFVKGDYSITRDIVINKPKSEVFNYIKYLKNQNDYSKWAKMDPGMKTGFRGTDGQPGFTSAWSSDRDSVGKGEQEIKKIDEGKRIDYEIRFIEPMEAVAPAYMITDSIAPVQTKVTWGFEEHVPYPFNIMCLFFDVEKMIGNDLQTGLNNLKVKLEQ